LQVNRNITKIYENFSAGETDDERRLAAEDPMTRWTALESYYARMTCFVLIVIVVVVAIVAFVLYVWG
jgi:hypothetical protein